MTQTLDGAFRTDVRGQRPQLRLTPRALRLLDQMRAESGEVALLVAPRLSAEVLCVGRRDLTLGPHDVRVATIHGCPIYVDRRDVPLSALRSLVLDAQPDLGGPRFVLQSRIGASS